MAYRRLVCVPVADNVSTRTDSRRIGIESAGIIKVSIVAVLVDKPMCGESGVHPHSDNNSGVVDGVELRSYGPRKGNVECGQDILAKNKTMFVAIISDVSADDISRVVDAAGEAGMRPQNSSRIQRTVTAMVQEKGMPAGNGVVCTDDLAVAVQAENQRHRRPRIYKGFVLIRALYLAEAPQDETSHCDHKRLLHMRSSNHSTF